MGKVIVQFYKYDGALHWGIETTPLGEDEWGIWLSYPRGAGRWKGNEPRHPNPHAAVICVPHEDWWLLHYSPGHPNITHFIDVNTPGAWGEDRVEMIDLDLDVVVNVDGTVEIDDEDEFIVHQTQLEYPPDLIAHARQTTDRLFEIVTAREEPFFNTAAGWFNRA